MKIQPDITQVAFLLSIPPVINVAEFPFSAKLIAGRIFNGNVKSYNLKNF